MQIKRRLGMQTTQDKRRLRAQKRKVPKRWRMKNHKTQQNQNITAVDRPRQKIETRMKETI